jgi:hypothetical protein
VGVPQQLWAGVDAGKLEHHCVVIDVDGKRVLSRRVPNDEATLGELISAVTTLADHLPSNIKRLVAHALVVERAGACAVVDGAEGPSVMAS